MPAQVAVAALLLCLSGAARAQAFEPGNGDVPAKAIRVTLLGTASGPRVHTGMAGISTLVEAGGGARKLAARLADAEIAADRS